MIGSISCRTKFKQGTMVQQFDFWATIVASNKRELLWGFEEITYLDTADRELQKMLDMHISKLNYNLVDNEIMQTAQTPPSYKNINTKKHLGVSNGVCNGVGNGVGNRVRWMRISLEQTSPSNSNTTPSPPHPSAIPPSTTI